MPFAMAGNAQYQLLRSWRVCSQWQRPRTAGRVLTTFCEYDVSLPCYIYRMLMMLWSIVPSHYWTTMGGRQRSTS